jgi:hypothetical protein
MEDGGGGGMEPNKKRVKKHGPLPINSFTEVSNKIITSFHSLLQDIKCWPVISFKRSVSADGNLYKKFCANSLVTDMDRPVHYTTVGYYRYRISS